MDKKVSKSDRYHLENGFSKLIQEKRKALSREYFDLALNYYIEHNLFITFENKPFLNSNFFYNLRDYITKDEIILYLSEFDYGICFTKTDYKEWVYKNTLVMERTDDYLCRDGRFGGQYTIRYVDGKIHALDKPAIKYKKPKISKNRVNKSNFRDIGYAGHPGNINLIYDIVEEWWVNDQLHRLDGPSIVCEDPDNNLWFVEGVRLSEEEIIEHKRNEILKLL